MIIDEGFLSNAKKIASTQSKSEVKAPVIKKENYEYHVTFSNYGEYSIWKGMMKLIRMLDIFKEISEDIKYGYDTCEFDADMFLTIDNVYMMYSKYYSLVESESSLSGTVNGAITIKNNETGKTYGIYLERKLYKGCISIYDNPYSSDAIKILRKLSELCTFLGINKDNVNFTKWMIRNKITMIENTLNNRSDMLPVYSEGKLMDMITGLKSGITIWKDKRNIFNEQDINLCSRTSESLKAIEKFRINKQTEFLIYEISSDQFFYINVYPMKPVPYIEKGLTYVRITIKIDRNKNPEQIEQWERILNKESNRYLDINTTDTGVIDYKANII